MVAECSGRSCLMMLAMAKPLRSCMQCATARAVNKIARWALIASRVRWNMGRTRRSVCDSRIDSSTTGRSASRRPRRCHRGGVGVGDVSIQAPPAIVRGPDWPRRGCADRLGFDVIEQSRAAPRPCFLAAPPGPRLVARTARRSARIPNSGYRLLPELLLLPAVASNVQPRPVGGLSLGKGPPVSSSLHYVWRLRRPPDTGDIALLVAGATVPSAGSAEFVRGSFAALSAP